MVKKLKLVYGVGINDADYKVSLFACVDGKQKPIWVCPYYQTWVSMLARSYSKKYKAEYPTYKDVSVCEEWHLFSTFRSWMEQQDYNGKQLDKDLLVPGNKVYSPRTCVFVSGQVNNFLIDRGAGRGEYMIGVYWDKQNSKFKSQCSNPFTGKRDYLGRFEYELEAHLAWVKHKLELNIN